MLAYNAVSFKQPGPGNQEKNHVICLPLKQRKNEGGAPIDIQFTF